MKVRAGKALGAYWNLITLWTHLKGEIWLTPLEKRGSEKELRLGLAQDMNQSKTVNLVIAEYSLNNKIC